MRDEGRAMTQISISSGAKKRDFQFLAYVGRKGAIGKKVSRQVSKETHDARGNAMQCKARDRASTKAKARK